MHLHSPRTLLLLGCLSAVLGLPLPSGAACAPCARKDRTPPRVTMDAPAFAPTTSFPVRVEATDDRRIRSVRLLVDGRLFQERRRPPFHFSVSVGALPASICVVAVDGAGNASEELCRTVEGPPPAAPCRTNADCDAGSYCAKAAGDCDGEGKCAARPDICAAVYLPVCGCDGRKYGSSCAAARSGVSVASAGECP